MTERSVWLFCLVSESRAYVGLRYSKYTTHSTVCASGLLPCSARVCTVWQINNRVLFRISIFLCHVAGFHVVNRAVTLLLVATTVYEEFWRIFVANTVAHVHWLRGCLAAVASLRLVSPRAATDGVTPIFSLKNWRHFFLSFLIIATKCHPLDGVTRGDPAPHPFSDATATVSQFSWRVSVAATAIIRPICRMLCTGA